MSHILVVDDTAICREPIARLLQSQGHSVAATASGKTALAAATARTPDLVLLDLAMPEMDGITFLHHFRAIAACRTVPVIILTALPDVRLVRSAAQLGVRSYLLKSKFSWDELDARIVKELARAKCPPATASPQRSRGGAATSEASAGASAADDAPAAAPASLTREQTIHRVETHTVSKTLAGVVADVIGLASSPRGSVAELVTLIKRDALLATRVLQVANSAAFTTHKPRVTTVDEAVRNIGLSAVRNIATSVGIFEAFPSDGADGFNLMRCWQHSFAVAAILERITAQCDGVPPGLAHLVGLCHDLGEIVLRQCLAEPYEQASAYAITSGQPLADVQAAAFGVAVHELIPLIVARLALPPDIANPICEYAALGRGGAARGAARPTRIGEALRLADLYAHGLLLASSPHAVVAPLSQAECRSAIGSTCPEPIDELGLRCDVLSTTSLLARVSAKEESKLAQPLCPMRNVKVWFARHSAFSSFDPLGAALSQMCTVELNDRLPRPEELAGCDAVLVATPRPNLQGFTPADLDALGRGAARPNFSMLYLSGQADGLFAGGAPRADARVYPISLADLAAFLEAAEQLKPSKTTAPAAAA